MALFFRISSDDIAQFLADWYNAHPGTPNVWITGNVVPGPGLPTYLMTYSGAFELRKATLVFERTPDAGVVQDPAMCTFHLLNVTGGSPDATWTADDYELGEQELSAAWATIAGIYRAETSLVEINWRADGPAFKPFGSTLSPVLRRTSFNFPGSAAGTNELPPQVAISVTEVTDAKFTVLDVEGSGTQLRNRWGRFYLPAPAVGNPGSGGTSTLASGRLPQSVCEMISGSFANAYNNLYDGDLRPVMYSPTTGSAWDVTELHVDDIYDVIRSRRFKVPLTRAVEHIGP